MLNDYLPIIILLVLATVLGFLVLIIGALFGPRRPTQRKAAPYESGMIPYGPGTRRISVRYYLVAVLFILFDIETVFFLPWAVVFRQLGWFALIEMLVFIGILLIGFVYVWKKGALEWE
ncbi:NADH-quinone oxidoreductase subunit A [Leptolinea tardivitalis]|uniref:NADH-quinone oxidoreductase subunit A n=1 Tax=Leptolinea tardivitalis TaxID=229920 RepID=A0A0P6XHM8_9CHLR|nr:NADH-quinone oxidoreductase subunit A [Leptolinea tardivitalis]KPL70603.1 NADH-quinone oxidoreductase subunit A [Leptolinea tardivitalis]GAP22216.1 NADH dehydrogenase subunit A [Leptolinea tardivitalis]